MDPIAVIASQAPPTVVQTGKPAGPSPQPEETGPNFKEVLNKKKLEDEQAQAAAGAVAGAVAGLVNGVVPVQDMASQAVVKTECADVSSVTVKGGTQEVETVQSTAVTVIAAEMDASQVGQKEGYFGKPAVETPSAMSSTKAERPEAQKVVILPDQAEGATRPLIVDPSATPQTGQVESKAEIPQSQTAQPATGETFTVQAQTQPTEIPVAPGQCAVNIDTPVPEQTVRHNPAQSATTPVANRPILVNSEQAADLLQDVDAETVHVLNVKSAVVEPEISGYPFDREVIPEIEYELDTTTGLVPEQTGELQAETTARVSTSQNVVQAEQPATTGKQVETQTGQTIDAQPVARNQTDQVQTAVPAVVDVKQQEAGTDSQTAQTQVQPEVIAVTNRQAAPTIAPEQGHAESDKGSGTENQTIIQPVQSQTVHSHASAMQTGLSQEGGLGQNQDRSKNQADVSVRNNILTQVAQSEEPVSFDTTQPQTGEVGFSPSVLQTGNIQNPETTVLPQIGAENLQKIVDQVGLSLQTGRKVARIQLNPQDLGTIDIQLSSDANGVKVTILTEQASTGRLLEREMNTLRQSLQDAGLNLTHLHFGMKEQQSQTGQQFMQNETAWSGKRWNQKWNTASDTQPEDIMIGSRVASLTKSMIDYRI